MTTIKSWLNTWWLKVPEPRDISIAFTIIYIGVLITGVWTLINPPRTIQAEIGPVLMAAVGWFLIIGALLAMLGGATDVWLVERVGLAGIGAALAGYLWQIISLHFTEGGSRLTQFGLLCFLGGGLVVVRYLLIRYFTYRPRG